MPQFGRSSLTKLKSCHPLLQKVMNAAIEDYDFSIVYGFRGQAMQEAAFVAGNSKLRWPNSKHNKRPSQAVDVAPWPIDWEDEDRFLELGTVILSHARILQVPLRWGKDFKGLRDLPHFELVGVV